MRIPFSKPRNYREFRSDIIRPRPQGFIVMLLACLLLGVALFSLVPFQPAEHPQNLGSARLSDIKKNVLFGPEKALQFGILKYSDNDSLIRLAPAFTMVFISLLLYFMLRKWYTARVSLLTSVLFVCSSWFLFHGRTVNNDVMYIGVIPALMLSCMWLLSKRFRTRLPIASIMVALTLYVPGSWLFLLAAAIYFRRHIWRVFKIISLKLKFLCGFLFIACLAPLIYSFAFAQKQIIQWLGYNTSQNFVPKEIAMHFLDIPKQLFISGIDNPLQWLPGTPVFSVFGVAMILLGIYAYRAGLYAAREKLMVGSFVIAIILIGFGNVATISLLIPLFYLLMANGIAYMLQSWFAVFPKNPLARTVGVTLLTITVGFSCFYQLQRYFVAWPNAATTKAVIKHDS